MNEGKNEKMQKKLIGFWIEICALYHLLSWGTFSLGDFYSENSLGDFFIPFFAMPIIACIFYFCFRKKIYALNCITWKRNAAFFAIWVVISLIFGCVITTMTCEYNNWIVYQHTGGWENFLNGIEYPMFGILLGVGPLIIAVIGEIIIRICNISSKNKK